MALFTCAVCGKVFNRAPSHAARCPSGPFCSHRCFGVYEHGPNNPSWGGGNAPWPCERCGKISYNEPGSLHRHKFCSARCRQLTFISRRLVECPVCLSSFIRAGRQRFCGKTCASHFHQTAIRGEANGRYVLGDWVTRYAVGFTAKFRRAIHERDGHSCVICATPQEDTILQTHHLDASKTNHAPTNLVTLCASCHHKLHNQCVPNARMMRQYGSRLYAAAQRPMPSTT